MEIFWALYAIIFMLIVPIYYVEKYYNSLDMSYNKHIEFLKQEYKNINNRNIT